MRSRISIVFVFGCTAAVLAQTRPAAPANSVARFRTVSIMDDAQHIGGEAYHMLAPAGWQVEGGIVWTAAVSDPATPWVRLSGPGRREIGVLPSLVFVWNPNMFSRFFPPGSFYAGTEVQPPVLDPFQCIQRIIIPRHRRCWLHWGDHALFGDSLAARQPGRVPVALVGALACGAEAG